MKFLKYHLIIVIIILSKDVSSQQYLSPLDFNLLISGTFGELRNNHFHSGIDIKTEGVEGQKVRSISDGYVSRIKVSTSGYGKAIYITHPKTGHTSVYAHLQKFNNRISKFVKKKQYERESFEINIFLNDTTLKISKGEIIALSGNTGGSNGAHLHFEIRDTKSEHPINPLQFNFKVVDNISPLIKKIKIYAFDTTLVDGYNRDKIYPIKQYNNILTIDETPIVNGSFALAIFTYDKADYAYNKNGIYSIKVFIDNTLSYQFEVNELDFSTTRYINAHIDYCENKLSKNRYHRCFKLPNNKLLNYSNLINNGIISFKDTLLHSVDIIVNDIYKNEAKLSFKIKSTNNPFLKKCTLPANTFNKIFYYDSSNTFTTNDIKIDMPAYSIYEDLMFEYQITDSIKDTYGNIYSIHNKNIPVHLKYTIEIKADIADSLKSKTYIASTDSNGNYWYHGGKWEKNIIKTKVREFGDFCIVADTINPEIKGVNIFPFKTINKQTSIKLTIKDKHSGIKSFRGEIDGKWILMDYDYKRNILRYDIENDLKKGQHTFKLNVTDNVGNESNYISTFIY